MNMLFSSRNRNELIVTVDGTSASGKSTIARKLAYRFDALYINSGLLYRAIAWKALRKGVPLDDPEAITEVIACTRFVFKRNAERGTSFYLDGALQPKALGNEEVAQAASIIACHYLIRSPLSLLQIELIERHFRVVLEGRDAGTVVAPEAHVKFYIDALEGVRTSRRVAQLRKILGNEPNAAFISKSLLQRDTRDQTRSLAPMKPAGDAIIIDTSKIKISETLRKMSHHVTMRTGIKVARM